MSRQSTFNFVQAHHLAKPIEEAKVHVSFSPKTRALTFSRRNPEVDGYVGKYVQLYADTDKKALAWVFVKEGSLGDLKHATSVKRYGKNVVIAVPVGVTRVLGMDKPLKMVEVQSYRSGGMLDNNDYRYVSVR